MKNYDRSVGEGKRDLLLQLHSVLTDLSRFFKENLMENDRLLSLLDTDIRNLFQNSNESTESIDPLKCKKDPSPR